MSDAAKVEQQGDTLILKFESEAQAIQFKSIFENLLGNPMILKMTKKFQKRRR